MTVLACAFGQSQFWFAECADGYILKHGLNSCHHYTGLDWLLAFDKVPEHRE